MNDKDIREIHAKYKDKVIFARSINVLDALQNRQYVERQHQIYDMKYTTGILRADLEKICLERLSTLQMDLKNLFQ